MSSKNPEAKLSSSLNRPASTGTNKVSLSSFSYVFSELVQYCQSQQKLQEAGYGIGVRVLELITSRETKRREITIVSMLQFIQATVWKTLFGKVAEGLQKCPDKDNEYYIFDNDPITNRYVSPPANNQLNCATFIAGIVQGTLDAADFSAEVVARFTTAKDLRRTVYVITFDKSVMARESSL